MTTGGQEEKPAVHGWAGLMARASVGSRLVPIGIIASILMGVFAVLQLPREEEPQIEVPMIEVMVAMPGASTEEVAERVARPMEKLLWEIPDVEYLYSTSMPGSAVVIARFEVGADLESALVRTNQKLQTNFDRIPHGVGQPLLKPRTIDDVPILALTLHSATEGPLTLRRVAAQLDDTIKQIPQVAETMLIGGARREIRVQLDPIRLASRGLAVSDVAPAIRQANRQSPLGSMVADNNEIRIRTGRFLPDVRAVRDVVVGVYNGQPVYLGDVATVLDGPEEPETYVHHAGGGADAPLVDAVTLTVAKRPGANAITVVDAVMDKVEAIRPATVPDTIALTVARDYGATAAEKSNELLMHMGMAVFGVAVLILLFLGWRDALVVLLAIPTTLALTLLVFYLYGYTLNRITLFALIFSIGILVDDGIVVVENIQRHLQLPGNRDRGLRIVAMEAVSEVGNPTILATIAVVCAILPMAFVGGLMGPYMRPIPIGSSAAMLFSLIIAFTVTPWAATRVLKLHGHGAPHLDATGQEVEPQDWFTRFYHWVMDPLIAHASARWAFLAGITVLLIGAMGLVGFGLVKVKMLPFDNKSSFQVILNMPEGTALETTQAVAAEMARAVRSEPEVSHTQVYAGTAAPFNFNGLVRQYYNRQGPTVADVQVNLLPRHARKAQSHDVALRVRPQLAAIAERHGGVVAVAEVPPGPPVLQTLVAEVYGPSRGDRMALAERVRAAFETHPDVVDVDWFVETPQPKVRFLIDEEKAALSGISEQTVADTLATALAGRSVDLLHQPSEREDVNILVEVPRDRRSRPADLLKLRIRAPGQPEAPLIPLSELVRIEETTTTPNVYRKNLKPVIYVTADVAGESESPAYAIFDIWREVGTWDVGDFGGEPGAAITQHHMFQPFTGDNPALKWDGEWHITLEVFRDLGIAFAAVLILIYMLMVGWFKSYVTPFVVMAAIPFSLIGILPAHAALGAFFTATSMIGFMAGAGIVVRNSIILVDFIELRMRQGSPLGDAVVEAGAIRFRPMLLTALALVVGASVILADPIFQGLAISLMFGEIASLLISRMAVPVLYFMANREQVAG